MRWKVVSLPGRWPQITGIRAKMVRKLLRKAIRNVLPARLYGRWCGSWAVWPTAGKITGVFIIIRRMEECATTRYIICSAIIWRGRPERLLSGSIRTRDSSCSPVLLISVCTVMAASGQGTTSPGGLISCWTWKCCRP